MAVGLICKVSNFFGSLAFLSAKYDAYWITGCLEGYFQYMKYTYNLFFFRFVSFKFVDYLFNRLRVLV